jgi:SAM-dependent methyltransferase
MSPDIAEAHKGVKTGAYWQGLTGGPTAAYKLAELDALIEARRPPEVRSLLDVGCGSCEAVFHYLKRFGGSRATLLDYDAAVLEGLKARHPEAAADPRITWLAADAFALGGRPERHDIALLLDMVHEVYSFYGRPGRTPGEPVDHALGLAAVERLLDGVCAAMNPGGLVCITDNVLCEERGPVRVRVLNPAARGAVARFLAEYPTRRMPARLDGDELSLPARDFCILLTQYNKIKRGDWARWNVEKLEIHQYWTLAEYRRAFATRDCELFASVGTPPDAAAEWREDFAVLEGLPGIPEKRITLAARKRGGA